MRRITFDGYIESRAWCDDDITPDRLRDELDGGEPDDDVEIVLNSYGGDCNAAVRMFDLLRAYKGKTRVVISGTAASAATVFIQGADEVVMTPGSLFMIHDPLTMAMGNERDLRDAIKILQACKKSIIAMYKARSPLSEDALAAMMTKTSWLTASEALEAGLINSILEGGAENRAADMTQAVAGWNAWKDRHGLTPARDEEPDDDEPDEDEPDQPEEEPDEGDPDRPEEPEEDEPEEDDAEEPEEEPDEEKPEEDDAAAEAAARDEIARWLAGELMREA